MQVEGTLHLSTQTLGITDRAEAWPAQKKEENGFRGMFSYELSSQQQAERPFPDSAIRYITS